MDYEEYVVPMFQLCPTRVTLHCPLEHSAFLAELFPGPGNERRSCRSYACGVYLSRRSCQRIGGFSRNPSYTRTTAASFAALTSRPPVEVRSWAPKLTPIFFRKAVGGSPPAKTQT